MIHRNEFREDVFYRLNTLTIEIPSLSERTDDISALVHFFLKSSGRAPFSPGPIFSSAMLP